MHWSGRVPIEATLVLVINHPWVWRLINAAMLLLFCHSAGRLALASTGKSGATTTSLAFAFLMLVSPDMLYPAAVIGWARERIAIYKAPKSVDLVDALPRNPSGKVLRRELRAPYWDGRHRAVGDGERVGEGRGVNERVDLGGRSN